MSLRVRHRRQHSRSVGLWALRLCCVLAFAALAGCSWLDNKQRLLIYRPTPGEPTHFQAVRQADQRYFLAVSDTSTPTQFLAGARAASAFQQVEVWWLPSERADAPTLLYLHGTFRNLYQNTEKINALRQAGFSVLAVDYRGWGRSTAIVPSEQTILQDTALAWRELKAREPRAAMRVIYGHSMGSGAAVALASSLLPHQDYGALILESAFTSFAELGREAGWLTGVLAGLSDQRFDSLGRIAGVIAPLLMLHGSADTTVPAALGKKLFAAAHPPKQWVLIAGGSHSGLQADDPQAYQDALRQFMQTYLTP